MRVVRGSCSCWLRCVLLCAANVVTVPLCCNEISNVLNQLGITDTSLLAAASHGHAATEWTNTKKDPINDMQSESQVSPRHAHGKQCTLTCNHTSPQPLYTASTLRAISSKRFEQPECISGKPSSARPFSRLNVQRDREGRFLRRDAFAHGFTPRFPA